MTGRELVASSDALLGDVVIFSLLGDVQSDRYRCVLGAARTENCAGGELAHHPDGSRRVEQGESIRGIAVHGESPCHHCHYYMVSVHC